MKISSLFHFGRSVNKAYLYPARLPLGRNPFRDWVMIIVGLLFLIVLEASFGIFLFYSIAKVELFQNLLVSGESLLTINRKLLDSTLADFEQKERKFEALINSSEYLVDPSR